MLARPGRRGWSGSPRTTANIAARSPPGGSISRTAPIARSTSPPTAALVTARRSTLWRVYDFLWGLHIMDWRGHEDFNTPLLIGATLLGLIVVIAGIVMLPSRLGLTAWLRRRRASRPAGG